MVGNDIGCGRVTLPAVTNKKNNNGPIENKVTRQLHHRCARRADNNTVAHGV